MLNKLFVLLFITSLCFAGVYNIYDANGRKIKSIDSDNIKNYVLWLKEHGIVPFVLQNKENYANKIAKEKDVYLNLDSDTLWIESDKNQTLNICFERKKNIKYTTNLSKKILNDSCASFMMPSIVATKTIKIEDDNKNFFVINIAVGMKYLNLIGKKLKIGFNKSEPYADEIFPGGKDIIYSDSEKIIIGNATYLVDKYMVTKCDFLNLVKDDLKFGKKYQNSQRKNIDNIWQYRLGQNQLKNCVANDSAANIVYLYQALIYANNRSKNEGLEPYYKIETSNKISAELYLDSSFTVIDSEADKLGNSWLKVSVNKNSNGYRLPYYNEWMIFARGGDLVKTAPWGDSSVVLKKVLEYAWFAGETDLTLHSSKPVGLLKPNGYGLYDIFGLAEEFVLFPGKNPFKSLNNTPSCLKGGSLQTRLTEKINEVYIAPYWKWVDYGYSEINYGNSIGGFRLIRKL